MTKSKAPVSSFGAELMSVLRDGSNKQVEIVFETPQLAIRFSARINALRAAMRRENHVDSDRMYRAGIYISKQNKCCVIVAPKDSEFRSAIQSAKIDVGPPPETVHYEVPTPRPGTTDDPATSFLADVTEATSVPKKDGGDT